MFYFQTRLQSRLKWQLALLVFLLSSVELGREGEWVWPRWVLQGSAHDGKNLYWISYCCLWMCTFSSNVVYFMFYLAHNGASEQKYPPSATTLHFEFYAEPGPEVKVERKVKTLETFNYAVWNVLCLIIFLCVSLCSRPVVTHYTISTLSSLTRYSQKERLDFKMKVFISSVLVSPFAFALSLRFQKVHQRSWSRWPSCTTSRKTSRLCCSRTFGLLMGFPTTRRDCRLCRLGCMLSPF